MERSGKKKKKNLPENKSVENQECFYFDLSRQPVATCDASCIAFTKLVLLLLLLVYRVCSTCHSRDRTALPVCRTGCFVCFLSQRQPLMFLWIHSHGWMSQSSDSVAVINQPRFKERSVENAVSKRPNQTLPPHKILTYYWRYGVYLFWYVRFSHDKCDTLLKEIFFKYKIRWICTSRLLL